MAAGRHSVTLALDSDGTRTAAGLVILDGAVLLHETMPTRRCGPTDALFAAIIGLCDRMLAAGRIPAVDLVGIGVGCGRPMREYQPGEPPTSDLGVTPW